MCSGHYRRKTGDEETLGTWSVELQNTQPVQEISFIVIGFHQYIGLSTASSFVVNNHRIQQSKSKAHFKQSLMKIGLGVICGYENIHKKRTCVIFICSCAE